MSIQGQAGDSVFPGATDGTKKPRVVAGGSFNEDEVKC